jgi:cobalt-zinc-cadmium efflux system outer membrane protein
MQPIAMIALLCAIAGPAGAAELTLQAVLDAARSNVDVALASGALAAARADVASASHAPLPVLSAKLTTIDLQNGIGGGNALTQKRIDKSVGMDFTWERGDKRRLRTDAAQHAAAAAQADLEDVRLQQSLAASAAFYDLLAANERVDEVSGIEKSAVALSQTAARRLQAGDIGAQDAARSEIEAQRAQADLDASRLDRRRAAMALTLLTGLALDTEAPALASAWPPPDNAATGAADLADAVERRPDVQAARERVQAARAAFDGARALKKSDVTWGTSLDHYPGTSSRLLEVRMQMPLQWGYGYEGELRRAQAQLAQAEDALSKARRSGTIELQRLQAELLAAAQRRGRYESDILPRARRVADMAELAHRRGALSLTDLLDARRTLRATLLEASAARADHAKALTAWQLRAAPAGAVERRPL